MEGGFKERPSSATSEYSNIIKNSTRYSYVPEEVSVTRPMQPNVMTVDELGIIPIDCVRTSATG